MQMCLHLVGGNEIVWTKHLTPLDNCILVLSIGLLALRTPAAGEITHLVTVRMLTCKFLGAWQIVWSAFCAIAGSFSKTPVAMMAQSAAVTFGNSVYLGSC